MIPHGNQDWAEMAFARKKTCQRLISDRNPKQRTNCPAWCASYCREVTKTNFKPCFGKKQKPHDAPAPFSSSQLSSFCSLLAHVLCSMSMDRLCEKKLAPLGMTSVERFQLQTLGLLEQANAVCRAKCKELRILNHIRLCSPAAHAMPCFRLSDCSCCAQTSPWQVDEVSCWIMDLAFSHCNSHCSKLNQLQDVSRISEKKAPQSHNKFESTIGGLILQTPLFFQERSECFCWPTILTSLELRQCIQ